MFAFLKVNPYTLQYVSLDLNHTAPPTPAQPQIHWLYANTFFLVNKPTPMVPFNSRKMAFTLILFGTFVAIVKHNHLRSKKRAFYFKSLSASVGFFSSPEIENQNLFMFEIFEKKCHLCSIVSVLLPPLKFRISNLTFRGTFYCFQNIVSFPKR